MEASEGKLVSYFMVMDSVHTAIIWCLHTAKNKFQYDSYFHVISTCIKYHTLVAGNRLSMNYERHDFSRRFLANLTMRNKTRVLSFTLTRANIEILPRPFSAHLYLSF